MRAGGCITEADAPPEVARIPGVEEPCLIQYEGHVWSCSEQREIRARLHYSVTQENGRNTYRLLFIQPLAE